MSVRFNHSFGIRSFKTFFNRLVFILDLNPDISHFCTLSSLNNNIKTQIKHFFVISYSELSRKIATKASCVEIKVKSSEGVPCELMGIFDAF